MEVKNVSLGFRAMILQDVRTFITMASKNPRACSSFYVPDAKSMIVASRDDSSTSRRDGAYWGFVTSQAL